MVEEGKGPLLAGGSFRTRTKEKEKVSNCGNFWTDVIGKFLDIIELLIGVLIGAVLTYFLSMKAGRKQRLTENIYIPLVGHLGAIRNVIQDGREMPVLDDLDKERRGGWYFTIDEKVKKKVDSVYAQLKDYQIMYKASEATINGIINEEVKGILPKLEEFLALDRDRIPYDVDYQGRIVQQHVGHGNLRWCLLLEMTPRQFLRETKPRVNDSDIVCLINGHEVPRGLVDPVCDSALKKANVDEVVQETRSQRQSLLVELQKLRGLLTEKAGG